MPEEQTSQTPENKGTGDLAQTPENGTEGQTAAAAAPVTPPVDYEAKFKASQAEAIRLYQENQRLMQAVQSQPQPQQHQTQSDGNGDETYAKLTDALLDRDYNRIKDWENRIVENATKKITQFQQTQGAKNTRIGASMQVVSEAFKEPNSPLGYEAMERYKAMMYDPSYQFVQQDEIDVPTPQGSIKVNPHLMRLAVIEAKSTLAGRLGAAKAKAGQEDGFIESAAGGQQKKADTGKFDASRHLTDTERAYCDKTRKSYDDYWKFMDPKIQAARLKAGKPLSRAEVK